MDEQHGSKRLVERLAREDDFTLDAISDALVLRQSRAGYRFGLDALLLATDLPTLHDDALIYDLGAAQGPVALCVAARCPRARVVAVERQDSLFALLRENITRNGLSGRVEARQLDLTRYRGELPHNAAELVLCNPPYFPIGKRRPSQNPERAHARHELHGTLRDFLQAAQYVLKSRGWLKLILPPWRLAEVLDSRGDLAPVSVRFIHASPGQDAYLMEIWMRRGAASDLCIKPMLLVRGQDQRFTAEVAARVAGAAQAAPSPEAIAHVKAQSLVSHLRGGEP